MAERYTRRDFLVGVLACGTLTATATYLLPGGRARPTIELTLVTGTDSTGARELLVRTWNSLHPEVIVRLEPVDGETFDQRDRMLTRAQDGTADIVNLDVIHISHFAGRGLIRPIQIGDAGDFLPRTLTGHRVDGDDELWAAPFNTDVGMLFQRVPDFGEGGSPSLADVLDTEVAPGSEQFVGQLNPTSSVSYEAFVVNVLEHALAREPGIVTEVGTPVYELTAWQSALDPLRDAIARGKVHATATEGDSLDRFQSEARPRFMRNWPVMYRELLQDANRDARAGRIRVSALPIGILGGQSLAVVNGSEHHEPAAEFIRYATSVDAQKILAAHGLAATRTAVYNDPNLQAFIPHLDVLRGAIEGARPRPAHPNYKAFNQAIIDHVTPFLHDDVALTADFITDMNRALSPT